MACKTELIWIVSIIALFILIITGVYINDKRRVRLTVQSTETNGHTRIVARTRLGVGVASPVPIAPLWWDKEEGAYMLKLKLGDSRVELVLDTGSSQISAKGAGCQYTSCEDGDSKSCSTQQCPCGTSLTKEGGAQERKDCNPFYYVPKGRFISPGEEGAGTKTKLVYGSQEDTVSHYMDAVSLPCMSDKTPMHHRFLLENIPATNEDDALNNNEYLLGNMIVHFVHHIQGTSSSNLVGLARPALKSLGPEYGRHVTIEKLLQGSENVWSLLLDPQGGWFILGSLAPSFPGVEYVPMVDPPMFRDFVTHFYVLDILSLEVGPDLKHMTLIKKRKPKYCILDTGTTYTYGCAALGKQLAETGYDELSWYVRLRLGSKKNNTVLTYSPADLQDVDFPSYSVFQCDAARTLPDFNAIFPDPDVLLFGALMMQRHYWEFDLERKRVGVCRVK
jgi:hypothetical protein